MPILMLSAVFVGLPSELHGIVPCLRLVGSHPGHGLKTGILTPSRGRFLLAQALLGQVVVRLASDPERSVAPPDAFQGQRHRR